jgi:hypothetical protein
VDHSKSKNTGALGWARLTEVAVLGCDAKQLARHVAQFNECSAKLTRQSRNVQRNRLADTIDDTPDNRLN